MTLLQLGYNASHKKWNNFKFSICITGRKSGILRIQYGHAAAAATEISFARDKLKYILVRPLKFGMWVYIGNAINTIVL